MTLKKIEILFENDDFIAVDKASGLLSIPDRYNTSSPCLLNILKAQLKNVFTVHRLDRDTSGLILFAKNESAHKYFSQLFEHRKIEKNYLAIVKGSMPESSGSIDAAIGNHPARPGEMVISKKGKESKTDYIVEKDFSIYSLVKFNIHSGRTHQVRVHAKYAGHPVICDEIYGDGQPVMLSSFKKKYHIAKDAEEKPLISRLGLHSYSLDFNDPSGKSHSLTCALPRDMNALLNQLEKIKG